jgi:hypothetical protein
MLVVVDIERRVDALANLALCMVKAFVELANTAAAITAVNNILLLVVCQEPIN